MMGSYMLTVIVYDCRLQSKDKATNKVRQISGYIVFAAKCRKDIQAEYPGCNFGEISRIVGNKVCEMNMSLTNLWNTSRILRFSALISIIAVTLHQVWLVLGWVTVRGSKHVCTILVCNQTLRQTQPVPLWVGEMSNAMVLATAAEENASSAMHNSSSGTRTAAIYRNFFCKFLVMLHVHIFPLVVLS